MEKALSSGLNLFLLIGSTCIGLGTTVVSLYLLAQNESTRNLVPFSLVIGILAALAFDRTVNLIVRKRS